MRSRSLSVTDAARTRDPRDEGLELQAFVVEHYRRLVRLAGIVCLSGADAQDAVQNGLERAWRYRRTQADPLRQKAWIDAIVVREAIRLNSRWRRLLWHAASQPDVAAPSALDAAARTDLAVALRRLSPAQRAAIALHHEAGYTVAETAEVLRAPVETVRSRLRLARERLRRELGEDPR